MLLVYKTLEKILKHASGFIKCILYSQEFTLDLPMHIVYFYSFSVHVLAPLYNCTTEEQLAVIHFLVETFSNLTLSFFLIYHASGSCSILLPLWAIKSVHVFKMWKRVFGNQICSEMVQSWWCFEMRGN